MSGVKGLILRKTFPVRFHMYHVCYDGSGKYLGDLAGPAKRIDEHGDAGVGTPGDGDAVLYGAKYRNSGMLIGTVGLAEPAVIGDVDQKFRPPVDEIADQLGIDRFETDQCRKFPGW